MTRDKIVAEIELALYGKIGNTFTPEQCHALDRLAERLAALSRPAPPDDLVALVREWQAALADYNAGMVSDDPVARRRRIERLNAIEPALLAWVAPAPVAAPAPETPAPDAMPAKRGHQIVALDRRHTITRYRP